ncbi:MAG TPA: endolytic transglycosylase MltG [Actinomycetota bacterium]|nr:endolytic transglycosylase MltG [Actinomycetota bacterium]
MASTAPPPPPPGPGRAARHDRSRARRPSFVIALVAFLVVGAGIAWAASTYSTCRTPPDAGGAVDLVVPEGATGQDVVALLREQGLTRCDGFVGNLLLRGTGAADELLAGEYTVTVGTPLEDIVTLLSTPPASVPTKRVTVPEGLRIRSTYPGERSIASVVKEQLGLSAERFSDLAESGRYALPPYLPEGTATAEGFLFPETYQLVRKGLDEDAVIRHLLEQFDREAEGLPWENAEDLGVTPYQAVIVASMVEREAQVDRERPLIAGVIYERLRRGMALGIDATLLYDDPTPDGQLSTADIETDGPYNTRMRAGLPPTPIAAPGAASLRAALEPEASAYLYYVLCPKEGDGVHRFARTYDEHLANVRECLG